MTATNIWVCSGESPVVRRIDRFSKIVSKIKYSFPQPGICISGYYLLKPGETSLILYVREFINRCFACMKAWQYTRKLCKTEDGFVG